MVGYTTEHATLKHRVPAKSTTHADLTSQQNQEVKEVRSLKTPKRRMAIPCARKLPLERNPSANALATKSVVERLEKAVCLGTRKISNVLNNARSKSGGRPKGAHGTGAKWWRSHPKECESECTKSVFCGPSLVFQRVERKHDGTKSHHRIEGEPAKRLRLQEFCRSTQRTTVVMKENMPCYSCAQKDVGEGKAEYSAQ